MTRSPYHWIARHARRGCEWLVRSEHVKRLRDAARGSGNRLSLQRSKRADGYHVLRVK